MLLYRIKHLQNKLARKSVANILPKVFLPVSLQLEKFAIFQPLLGNKLQSCSREF